ncbi:hypothetical protein Rhe02_47860 [Rhizocola hellebori]|uniref:DUF624 domain-containing protein n=1 Tax=Rhizocola hellebori TaxID=1392758 RepID=A0A8J3Q9S4_9ACTN|nr:DUF624 domain-containing protein [Rhizocola hellebori]GIH06719.1 hypothetical protein Rhe02_47860 [Rhizocola hellebori]
MAGIDVIQDRRGPAWASHLHPVFSTIAWCAALNAMWLAFTLLGGVVLGAGPATVAACIVARRHLRGETIRWRDFAAVWRKEFWRGTIVVAPVAAVVILLYSNYVYFSALGPAAGGARLVTLAALMLAIGAGSYVAPMYAHYDLPLHRYAPKALRFALGRPASTFILVFSFAVCAVITALMPVLLAVISIGLWWQASTYLCVRFFQENEDRLARRADPESAVPMTSLPVEPLRIR